ncbi:hypothetical protein pipiens_015165 [Culex pipiens pipiens]|uniref:Uncharacterized protein n=1 Tax=Culex pipiens pipiens TaxID=38569 RepID=A0ABD1CRT1_CULPP
MIARVKTTKIGSNGIRRTWFSRCATGVVVEFFVETVSKKDKAKDFVRGNSRTNKNEEIPIPVLVLVGIPQKCCSAQLCEGAVLAMAQRNAVWVAGRQHDISTTETVHVGDHLKLIGFAFKKKF